MNSKISVVINTLNEEKYITRSIRSVLWADEVLVCDMHSVDKTVKIAKSLGAKVLTHKKLDYVEPARNFAISKASHDWILVLDPDEEVQESLKLRLIEISKKMEQINYVRIPRKNIIFNKWIKNTGWWPDYNIRFFKKGKVKWSDKIHRPPEVLGEGIDLEASEQYAIVHHHYDSISQFLERMSRYTKTQSDELVKDGYVFDWKDLIKKPLGEFLSRFFANRGFKDGLHGLSLSLLQAFSQFVLYLRVWEMKGFQPGEVPSKELKELSDQSAGELNYWFKYGNPVRNPFKKIFQKIF